MKLLSLHTGFSLVAVAIALLHVAEGARAAEQTKPITISAGDFIPSKEEILDEASNLTALEPTLNGSADYARRFGRLQSDAARVRPRVSDWPEADRDLLAAVPAPNEAARGALAQDEKASEQRQQRRAAETEAAWRNRIAANAARDRQDLERDRLNIQAREAEARAREAEARAEAYDDSTWPAYPYLGHRPGLPWYWRHRQHGGHKPNRPTHLLGDKYLAPQPSIRR